MESLVKARSVGTLPGGALPSDHRSLTTAPSIGYSVASVLILPEPLSVRAPKKGETTKSVPFDAGAYPRCTVSTKGIMLSKATTLTGIAILAWILCPSLSLALQLRSFPDTQSGVANAEAAFPPSPVPFISQPLTPTAVAPGGPGFTLTVHGANFAYGAVVNWNSNPRTTRFLSADALEADILPSDVASTSTAAITVANPASTTTSNTLYLSVTFPTQHLAFSSPSCPRPAGEGLAFADFNRDGKIDAAGNAAGIGTGISVALGKGDGCFQNPNSYTLAGGARSITTSDFNNDRMLDLAVLGLDRIELLMGNGDGTFRAPMGIAVAGGTTLACGDFDQDGNVDIAVSTNTSIDILQGDGVGSFRRVGTYAFAGSRITIGDFNNDSVLDIAAISYQSPFTQLTVLLGNGDGTFRAANSRNHCCGDTPFGHIASADLNGDGKLDLMTVERIFLGLGDGTFQDSKYFPGLSDRFDIGDINGDGALDLVMVYIPTVDEERTAYFLGARDGSFPSFPIDISTRGGNSVHLADLNNDGRLDAVSDLVFLQIPPAPVVTLSTRNLSFGNQAVGTVSQSQNVILTNSGSAPLSIASITLAGPNAIEFFQTNDCSSPLAAGSGCTITVRFTPTALGSKTAAVNITDNASDSPQTISLSAVGGVAVGSVSPSSLAFAAQPVNTTSAAQRVSLFNTGDAPLTMTSFGITGDFAIQTNRCANGVKPGTHCDVFVAFTPKQAGARSGTLSFVDNAANSPQTVRLTGVGTSSTTTTLASAPNPSALGQAVTLTAVVVPQYNGTPTGSATFYDGTKPLKTVAFNLGAAKLVVANLTSGTHALKVSYGGDAAFAPSTSNVVAQVVRRGLANVILGSSPNPSYVDQAIVFTATVSGVPGFVPTGSVNFQKGTLVLATVPLINGKAVYNTSFGTSGISYIKAVYVGDLNYPGKTSNVVKQVVQKYSTSTHLVSSLNPSGYGQAVKFTATVTSAGPAPSGTVKFVDGSVTLGSATVSGGVATLTKPKLAVGTHPITALYLGGVVSDKSTSPILGQVVQ